MRVNIIKYVEKQNYTLNTQQIEYELLKTIKPLKTSTSTYVNKDDLLVNRWNSKH